MSASLWGCELKWIFPATFRRGSSQPPCEAVSWNVEDSVIDISGGCQPPCEAVSWNFAVAVESVSMIVSLLVRLWVEIFFLYSSQFAHGSASLWGCELKWAINGQICHGWRSASLWGCELKCRPFPLIPAPFPCQPPCEAVSWNNTTEYSWMWSLWSASLWGCELKLHSSVWYLPRQVVSLLVRLWVEIAQRERHQQNRKASASLWGCELKCDHGVRQLYHRQSASLWGCELKYQYLAYETWKKMSASLWGCELKCQFDCHIRSGIWVSLLVRLWVEMCLPPHWCPLQTCQPPCEAVSWNNSQSN